MNTKTKFKVTNISDIVRRVWINGRNLFVEPNNSFKTDYPPEEDYWKVEKQKESKLGKTKEILSSEIIEE